MKQKESQPRTSQATKRAIRKKVSKQREPQYAEITIAALTGEVSAKEFYDPPTQPSRGSVSGIWSLERAWENLADGGYVIDLRPLAPHPKLFTWVYQAPMPNGCIEGNEIDRLSAGARESAGQMLYGLQGEYQQLAFLASKGIGEPIDGSAGPFDYVSASYRAMYWGSRGARIGKRVGNAIHWSDGRQQVIGFPSEENLGDKDPQASLRSPEEVK